MPNGPAARQRTEPPPAAATTTVPDDGDPDASLFPNAA
jgi:hypothetical protein